jgi:thiamine-phosphate pyrophosphorylase
VVASAAAFGADVVINDRVDVARLGGAAGAHVGQEDVPARTARNLLGPQALIGLSTHSRAQIDTAVLEPVSYIAIGPVFGTDTKATGYEPVGLELVRAAAANLRGLPVVAIGGITLATAPAVIAAGASAVAVITDLLSTGDPSARVRAYLDATARLSGHV